MSSFSKQLLFRWVRVLAAPAIVMMMTSVGNSAVYLEIDGRDVANLAGDGNHAPFHNPPVNFAFTFGNVAADNPDAGPGDPPAADEIHFNYTGSDFGALGFGTASAGDTAFPSTAVFRMLVTVNPANTLANLVLNLKDADPPLHLIEEHQYQLPLGAAGTKIIETQLLIPSFTNTPRNGIPDFLAGNGLTELQLQYPFGAGGTGAILDVTIHRMRIMDAPEPTSFVVAAGFTLCSLCGLRRRRIG